MAEKVDLLSEVLQVESKSQQVCELSRLTEELQQCIKTRLQSLEDADKVPSTKRHIIYYLFVTFPNILLLVVRSRIYLHKYMHLILYNDK